MSDAHITHKIRDTQILGLQARASVIEHVSGNITESGHRSQHRAIRRCAFFFSSTEAASKTHSASPSAKIIDIAWLLNYVQDLNMAFFVLGCVAALSCLILLLSKAIRPVYDPREPPLISHPLPIIGHLIGMLRYGSGYYEQIA